MDVRVELSPGEDAYGIQRKQKDMQMLRYE